MNCSDLALIEKFSKYTLEIHPGNFAGAKPPFELL
jgi:hypothetical protein